MGRVILGAAALAAALFLGGCASARLEGGPALGLAPIAFSAAPGAVTPTPAHAAARTRKRIALAPRGPIEPTAPLCRGAARKLAQALGLLTRPPVADAALTSGFGRRRGRLHAGVDLAAPIGAPVSAAGAGVVRSVGRRGGYGLMIEIAHACGVVSRYAHLSRAEVSVGDAVAAGARIGRVGRSGRATGPHLHFELRRDGRPFDPSPAPAPLLAAARPRAGGARDRDRS